MKAPFGLSAETRGQALHDRAPTPYVTEMKVREVLRGLKSDGWVRVKSRGGHRQFKHPARPGRVTVSGKLSDTLPRGTLGSIFREAGWEE